MLFLFSIVSYSITHFIYYPLDLRQITNFLTKKKENIVHNKRNSYLYFIVFHQLSVPKAIFWCTCTKNYDSILPEACHISSSKRRRIANSSDCYLFKNCGQSQPPCQLFPGLQAWIQLRSNCLQLLLNKKQHCFSNAVGRQVQFQEGISSRPRLP